MYIIFILSYSVLDIIYSLYIWRLSMKICCLDNIRIECLYIHPPVPD